MKTVEIIYRYLSPGAPTRPRPHDAEAARLRLSDGNQAFATLLDGLSQGAGLAQRVIDVDPRDLGLLQGEHSAPTQHPFAVVLGCSDARVPIELIFNEGPNDLFVVRVAGNGLGHDVLGSLWYALEHLRESLRLVVILGLAAVVRCRRRSMPFFTRSATCRYQRVTRFAAFSTGC
jgi:carbonic anhydrase